MFSSGDATDTGYDERREQGRLVREYGLLRRPKKRVAVYDFLAGETYNLVISGRSQEFKLDRVVFRVPG